MGGETGRQTDAGRKGEEKEEDEDEKKGVRF